MKSLLTPDADGPSSIAIQRLMAAFIDSGKPVVGDVSI